MISTRFSMKLDPKINMTVSLPSGETAKNMNIYLKLINELGSTFQIIRYQDSFRFLKIIEDCKELLLVKLISINIYHIRN